MVKKDKLNPHGDNFSPMLFPNDAVGYEVITKPMMASYKLDGMRCLFKDGEMLSRQWKPIANKQLNDRFECMKKLTKINNAIYDGELYSSEMTFTELMHYCRTEDLGKEPLPDSIKYYIFDVVPEQPAIPEELDEEMKKMLTIDMRAIMRYYYMTGIALWDEKDRLRIPINTNKENFPYVEDLKQVIVSTPEEARRMFEEAIALGFEGLILKDPNSLYKYGRITTKSGDGYKFKPYQTWDAKIIGVEQATEVDPKAEKKITELGYSKTSRKKGDRIPIEKASAFRVMYEDKELKVSIAMTDEEKEKVWREKDSYIGKYIEYKGMLVGSKDVPRHPVYVRMRPDKDG
jgi:DNA ligase 1